MLMCAHRGASMLRAAVEVVAQVLFSEAFARAFVMFELGQVRDGQCRVLAVVAGPVLMRFHLVKDHHHPLMLRTRVVPRVGRPVDRFALGGCAVELLFNIEKGMESCRSECLGCPSTVRDMQAKVCVEWRSCRTCGAPFARASRL